MSCHAYDTGVDVVAINSNKCMITEAALSDLRKLPIVNMNKCQWCGVYILIFPNQQFVPYTSARFYSFEHASSYSLQVVVFGYRKSKQNISL